MLRNMLVGLDGTDYSGCAVELGIRWAQQTGAGLVGLGVVDEPTICRSEPVGIWGSYYKKRRDKKMMRGSTSSAGFLERFTLRCEEAGVRHRILEEVGLPFERILFRAEDLDLTLLGRETHFQFQTQTAPIARSKKCCVRAVDRSSLFRGVCRNVGRRAGVRCRTVIGASPRSLSIIGNPADGRPIRVVSVAADEGVGPTPTRRSPSYDTTTLKPVLCPSSATGRLKQFSTKPSDAQPT